MNTIEDAIEEMKLAGRFVQSNRYGSFLEYELHFSGMTIRAQGYDTINRIATLTIEDLFKPVRNLHPILRLYQDFRAIQAMRDDGMTVLLGVTSSRAFRVRVQRREGKRFTYNVHTTSTSGYPILSAYEKYQAWKAGE